MKKSTHNSLLSAKLKLLYFGHIIQILSSLNMFMMLVKEKEKEEDQQQIGQLNYSNDGHTIGRSERLE